MVDDEDFEELNKHKWHIRRCKNTCYALRTTKRPNQRAIPMHREIMNTPKGLQTDHIDGNGLNNCRSNLRIVTSRQNLQNRHTPQRSSFPGVDFHKGAQKWRSRININGKEKHLGLFKTEVEAHEAYLKALENMNEIYVDKILKGGS